MQLVVEILDPKTECVIERLDIEAPEEDLPTSLAVEDLDAGAAFVLDGELIKWVQEHARFALSQRTVVARIRQRRKYDDLSYATHTNRELNLMLKGQKPLASFVGQYPPHLEIEEIPERLFDPYVVLGRFVKREYVEIDSASGRKLRRVLYALPSEDWRIDAYILLHETASTSGWSEGFERMEGALLGYSHWQIEEHLKHWSSQ